MKKTIKSMAIILLTILLFSLTGCNSEIEENNNFKIVTSFYPMYIITKNITTGAKNVSLSNMTDVNVGCIHNYTLTTSDLLKLETADVFVENGLEIENFTDKITNTYRNLKIINASENIEDTIRHEDEINAHVWGDIEKYIEQVKKVSEKLVEYNPENEQIYISNTNRYISELEELKATLNNDSTKKALVMSEGVEYIVKSCGINYELLHIGHDESSLASSDIANVVNKMKQENIKNIIVEKNDSTKNAEIIARECGAKIYVLDSCLSGERNNNSYINAMKQNYQILKDM